MNRKIKYSALLTMSLLIGLCSAVGYSQETGVLLKGKVMESGTGLPLKQAIISVLKTGVIAESDSTGNFEIMVPDLQSEILVNLPGYDLRRFFIHGSDDITVSLVQARFSSLDDEVYTPMGITTRSDLIYPVSTIDVGAVQKTPITSLDRALQGRVAGLYAVGHSGMPGQKSWVNIGGISSIYCKQDPMLIIDGMIHETNYADYSIIDGYSMNPFDIIDIQDVSDISVIKGNLPYWGSMGSTGAIYINSEQKSETSSAIEFTAYGGAGLSPAKLGVLNVDDFENLFREQLAGQGLSDQDVQETYPWLDGGPGSEDYYRYNNNTDWQDELYTPSAFQKYHIFLKGGDDIATYNISTGYLRHGGVYDNSHYQRYNLRINGKINITDRFTVLPNVKLSLADSYLANMGPNETTNPVLAALLKSPNMAPYARDSVTGESLAELDDVGVFNVSNPIAIVNNGIGDNRNYHFLSSIDAQYRISDRFFISSLTGFDFNNSREGIFLPDVGLVDGEYASNVRRDLVYEFRSFQNHTKVVYNHINSRGNWLNASLGLRYMKNSYKYDEGNDLNTPSDDFRNLGQGAKYQYLRTTLGDNRELKLMSYYGAVNYAIGDKYYMGANVTFDGNSNLTSETRYNLYPSVNLAWRLTSEEFLSSLRRVGDFKLRVSYGLSGNLHSSVYDYSKMFYVGQRWNRFGVLLRDAIPNPDLEIEKKATFNTGLDLTLFNQTTNINFDYFNARTGNMVINQELPDELGFTDYYNNGGSIVTNAYELSIDTRIHMSDLVLTLGASGSMYKSEIQKLDFLSDTKTQIVYDVNGMQYVTAEGNAVNMFYGYETDGIYNAATSVIGPRGFTMQEGDVRYVDQNGDNMINEDDKALIGDPNPDFYGGFLASLSYKNIELSAVFNYSIGNDIYNYVRYKTESMDQYYNQFTTVNERYSVTNTGTDFPKAAYGDTRGNTLFSDRWIEDGSYLKLKELTLSYVPPKFSGVYRDLTLFLTASNLFTVTKYSGYDPETFYRNNPFYMGVDYGKIPHVRSVVIGIKLAL